MKFSLDCVSGPNSCSRVNTISKVPVECAAQREASTDTLAVHLRCMVGGCIGETFTSWTIKFGRHAGWQRTFVAAEITTRPARNADAQKRVNCSFIPGQASANARAPKRPSIIGGRERCTTHRFSRGYEKN